MRIEPAHIDQIRRASHGRMVMISADVGGVAEELQRIDPGLKVRFAENGNPPFWGVYWESEDRRNTYLVTTVQAYQNHAGVWEGLDSRLVEHIRSIDPQGRSGYDYGLELQKANERVDEARKQRFRDETAPIAEMAAHAIRKDLGIKSRSFVPRDIVA